MYITYLLFQAAGAGCQYWQGVRRGGGEGTTGEKKIGAQGERMLTNVCDIMRVCRFRWQEEMGKPPM